jgi:hypothetical protein
MYFQFYDSLLSDDYLNFINDKYHPGYDSKRMLEFIKTEEYREFLIEIFAVETPKIYKRFESDILKAESKERQESLILFIINSVDEYYEKLGEDKNFDLIYEEFEIDLKRLKSKIIRRFGHLLPPQLLKESSNPWNPKIKWLGNVNLLTTLIYDLWKGQDKGKGNAPSEPLIKVNKKEDLIELICKNFINSKGEAFSPSSLSTYFGPKSINKVKGGNRIEIPN